MRKTHTNAYKLKDKRLKLKSVICKKYLAVNLIIWGGGGIILLFLVASLLIWFKLNNHLILARSTFFATNCSFAKIWALFGPWKKKKNTFYYLYNLVNFDKEVKLQALIVRLKLSSTEYLDSSHAPPYKTWRNLSTKNV